MRNNYISRQNSLEDPVILDENIKIVPLHSSNIQGCRTGIPGHYEYSEKFINDWKNPINKVHSDFKSGNIVSVKELIKVTQEKNNETVSQAGSIHSKTTGTELMKLENGIPNNFKESNPNINTMYCDSSTLLSNDIYFVKKDDCNMLQILVPMKNLRTMVGGNAGLFDEYSFSNSFQDPDGIYHEDDFMLEIGCEIKEINKVLKPNLNKLI